jgi:hypothetical protein
MNLELIALRWLWLERKCHYVLEQRSPRHHLGSPDVIGVTRDRYLVEIEIKRSVADFKRDAEKYSRRNRELFIDHMAKQFYYLVTPEISDKILPLLPAWAGLMTVSENQITAYVLQPAPVNRESKKLSVQECIKLTRCMTNHMMATKIKLAEDMGRFMHRDEQNYVDWVSHLEGTWQI